MTLHIFAIGRINGDHVDVTLAPQYKPASEDAYAIGEMDGDDGCPCDPLTYFSDLASIEAYIIGWNEAQFEHGKHQALREYGATHLVDGTLEDLADIANADIMAEEWGEYFLDQGWMRGDL